ncbi:MAG: GlcNAc-PI de-N-acetylase [Candidatus Glassbacteria bacterium GWA2_58_10]|uniref:GlcNAc-PI de-N-acetylase n=1 Tax=Candidatus Glassbacteria bacterium GWA2_58_10 TaxID=1817865 RepID=A0A1F5YHW2_9BACT|nr:MAG: GlcNAc-PI de-N-acetylase [Candidatus Glassbacteria bacterium GWA2_58_10]
MKQLHRVSRLFLFPLLLAWSAPGTGPAAAAEPLRVIMIGAHPDDCEFMGGGTAMLWVAAGAKVQFVAVTNGDAGHQSEGGGALAHRRAAEARRSAEILGVSWRTLDFHDGELVPSLEARKAVIRAIRNWQADIVFSPRPNDYHPDHRYTGVLVQDAAYMVAVPNVCPDTPRLEHNPIFMYFYDHFQKPLPFTADVAVDVDPVIDKKWQAIASMECQMFEWIPWLDGKLAQVPADKAARLEWLKSDLGGWLMGWTDSCRKTLVERYGAEHGGKVKFGEGFEVCEYGRRPGREELWKIFPK